MVRKISICMLVTFLALSLFACGKPSPSSSQAVLATPQGGSLTVSSTSAFTDQFGSYHVVGAVHNGTTSSLSSIELGVELKDASGNSLLRDESGIVMPSRTFAPMLNSLAPGESSPYNFSYDLANGQPAAYQVTISGYESGKTDRVALNAENVQLVDDGKGTLYLSGELINTGSQWARLNSLAGAIVDGSESPISAGASFIHANLLAPAGDPEDRDQTPFIVSFPSLGPGQTDWRIYWDADLVSAPDNNPLTINFTNSYFDQTGVYHIVGFMTNNAATPLNPQLVAGLYSEDGVVLDAANTYHPVSVDPAENMPFDISSFGSVNTVPDQASRVRTFTVQVDPGRTTQPSYGTVELAASAEQVKRNDSIWIFSGTVTNTAGQNLNGVTVIVSVEDGQDNLVATNNVYILPAGESIPPDGTITYEILVALDPTVDTKDFQTSAIAIGDVSR